MTVNVVVDDQHQPAMGTEWPSFVMSQDVSSEDEAELRGRPDWEIIDGYWRFMLIGTSQF